MNFLDFFQEERIQEAFRRIAIGIGITALAIFFTHGIWQLARKSYTLTAEQHKKEQELAALIKERERLEADIAYLKSASAFEREAKTRLNYKRIGEEVVIVVPEGQNAAGSFATTSAKERPSLWESVRRWIPYLFGRQE